jgi:1,4-dihydroxy-2-naphthoate octaprenyltransferase
VVIAMVLMGVYSFFYADNSIFLVLVAFVPLGIHLISIRKIENPKNYDPQLKVLALSTFGLALLFSVSLL